MLYLLNTCKTAGCFRLLRWGREDVATPTPLRKRDLKGLLRGTIVNRTYGTHKNLPGICFAIFTNTIWSYLLWSPVIAHEGVFIYRYHTVAQRHFLLLLLLLIYVSIWSNWISGFSFYADGVIGTSATHGPMVKNKRANAKISYTSFVRAKIRYILKPSEKRAPRAVLCPRRKSGKMKRATWPPKPKSFSFL